MNKYKVVMTNIVGIRTDSEGKTQVATQEAVDFVPEDILEDYVADARTRWQNVSVSDTPNN